MPHKDGTLKAREFLFFCEDLAMAGLPAGFPRPERRVMWTILQMHYGNPDVHVELQPHVGRGMVELGLHLEGPAEQNDRWAAVVGEHAPEMIAALGPEWELEDWTSSWRRLHRVFRFDKLTTALGHEVADDCTKALMAFHPLLAEAGGVYVPPPERPHSTGKGWRERRRAARR
jgi:hypothetical protein